MEIRILDFEDVNDLMTQVTVRPKKLKCGFDYLCKFADLSLAALSCIKNTSWPFEWIFDFYVPKFSWSVLLVRYSAVYLVRNS